jgi:hypothetical protein
VKTGPGPVPPSGAARTNAPKANTAKMNAVSTAKGGTNAPAGLAEKFQAFRASSLFYPAVAGVVVCLGVLIAFLVSRAKSKKASLALTTASGSVLPVKAAPTPKPVVRKVSKAAVNTCNILEVGPEARQVWQFDVRGNGLALGRQQTSLVGEALPGSLVTKDWRALLWRKLNVALLPPEHVFLRVVQIPRSDASETLAMVELQLEKLSPMPVAQVAWSFHVLPHATGNMQTVIVMMVSRNVVEEFLGKLENEGYLADRLELSVLDQIQATAITEDGAWIYPEPSAGSKSALVAWWYGGVLQNLDLLTLPPPSNRAAELKEQLTQMAWAGEMEGWLTSPPEWHLVADVAAPDWEKALREGLEQPVEVITPLAPAQLAGATARRAALADPRANLLPAEFAAEYQRRFLDRLWIRGLVALGVAYLAGVAIYMIAVVVANFQTSSVEKDLAAVAPAYTNAMQLEAKYKILKDRQDLKYAALDCWNATAQLLPENAALDHLSFQEGKRLSLSGTAPSDQLQRMNDFADAIGKATVNGQPLFNASAGNLQFRSQTTTAGWTLGLDLKRTEAP